MDYHFSINERDNCDSAGTSGRGDNLVLVHDVLHRSPVPLQVRARTNDEDVLEALLADGAAGIVVSSEGATNPGWLVEQATLAPGRLIAALDVRDGQIVPPSGPSRARVRVTDLIADLDVAPLAGLFVTSALWETRMPDPDLRFIEELVRESPWPVLLSANAAGSMRVLRNLEDRGVWAVVLGTALQTGELDVRVIAEEFAS